MTKPAALTVRPSTSKSRPVPPNENMKRDMCTPNNHRFKYPTTPSNTNLVLWKRCGCRRPDPSDVCHFCGYTRSELTLKQTRKTGRKTK
ncbi:MAG: hypothetical protein FWD52_04700 [Candidatus Bathyarchaeota archaeon]|nr:hypothetical protein [Candidatus Termiticorpusculum sp.]